MANKEQQFNQSLFYLSIDGKKLAVKTFESKDFSLSQDYKFILEVNNNERLNLADFINKEATVTFKGASGNTNIYGIVTDIQGYGITPDSRNYNYTITFCSPLHSLKLTTYNRIYLQKNINKLITELLNYHGWNKNNYELKIKHQYATREIFIQHNETDFDFLLRHLDHFGLFFAFIDKKLMITDDINQLPDWQGNNGEELLFQMLDGTDPCPEIAFNSITDSKLITQNVKLHDYNYKTPEVKLVAESSSRNSIPGFGKHYIYGENFLSQQEAEQFAKIRQQALDWQRYVLKLETNCPSLLPGQKIKLADHPISSYNRTYRIVSAQIKGDQSAGQVYGKAKHDRTYQNKIVLIPADISYRHPITQPKPLNGIQTAAIESTGGDYAYLDELGRYRIRMPYDLSNTKQGQASNPIRLMQHYSGQNYGMHFPLHKGTEVLYTCINGDINRPFLLGVVSNSDTPNVVTSKNSSQNILRTWGKNELLMDDNKKERRIELFTEDKQNILSLNAKENTHKVRLATQGDMNITAQKSLLHKSEDTNSHQSGNNHIVNVLNACRTNTKNQDIQLEAGRDIKFKTQHDINHEAETKDLTLKSGQHTLIKAKDMATIKALQGDLNINNIRGSCYFKAGKSINITTKNPGNIIIAQSGAKIHIDRESNINIQAKEINIKTQQNNLQGNQANLG
ncbi:MAG: hypothetical protein AMJ43_00890 [Coxiella sp. DG_40]|nr:MAG: hypothetical protein AMJ43_00890 [Coxiella sp. DG_40]